MPDFLHRMFANVTTMNGVKCYVMLKTTALLVCISVNNTNVIVQV